MARNLRVLAVGSVDPANLFRDVSLLRPRAILLAARNYWELCSLGIKTEFVSVAVLEISASDHDLRWKAEYIRRRWPDAQIILVGFSAEPLDDPLYDDRVLPGIEPSEMLAVIERVLKQKRRAKRARKINRDYRNVI